MRLRRRLAATALPILLSHVCACSTIDTRAGSYDGPPAYSGTRQAGDLFVVAFRSINLPLVVFELIDIVASGVADTLLLPITLAEQSAYNKARTEALRIDIEQPSVVSVAREEAPLRSARRLFRQCQTLISNFAREYPDCYSIAAEIEVTDDEGTRKLTGGEYKLLVRDYFEPNRGTGRFIRYIKPEYEEQEGSTVLIRAERIDSDFDGSEPVEFLVGPGEDDQWRIIREKSPGFSD